MFIEGDSLRQNGLSSIVTFSKSALFEHDFAQASQIQTVTVRREVQIAVMKTDAPSQAQHRSETVSRGLA